MRDATRVSRAADRGSRRSCRAHDSSATTQTQNTKAFRAPRIVSVLIVKSIGAVRLLSCTAFRIRTCTGGARVAELCTLTGVPII